MAYYIIYYNYKITIHKSQLCLSLHTDFQLIALSGLSGSVKTYSFFIRKNRLRNCDTGWVLCHISMVYISILFKPQKALLRWLFHLHSNFQLIPSRSLSCGRDRPLTLFYANNRS